MTERTLSSAAPTRRELVAGAALAAAAPFLAAPSCVRARTFSPAPLTGTLRARAARKGLLIGTALDPPEVADPRVRREVARDYDCLTPSNGFNWTRIQPKAGSPLCFDQAAPVIALARATGALVRLHNLHYDRTIPPWVKEAVRAGTPAQAAELLQTHVRDVLTRWAPIVSHINVVNEPEYGVGRPYRHDLFGDRIGEEYLEIAFHAARAAAPHALLFINISVVESVGRKFDNARAGVLGLIDRMLSRGVPVDAVGIEGHLDSTFPFDETLYASFLRELSSRGLRIMVSEFDVIDTAFPADIAARDAACAALLEAFLTTSFDNPRCLGGVAWSPIDRYSFLVTETALARRDRVARRPGLLDADFRRKPMWGAVARALDQAVPRTAAIRPRHRVA